MTDVVRTNTQIWERLYKSGHKLNYPNDVFVRIMHRLINPIQNPRVLDYGFGSGENLLHLAKRGHQPFGVEVSESALATTRSRFSEAGIEADLRLMHGSQIPFESSFFDVVYAWDVLYYNNWKTFEAALSELNRVLKPGGTFLGILLAPGHMQHKNSLPLGDSLYELQIANQGAAIILVLQENELARAFPGQELIIGSYGYRFGELEAANWILSYKKSKEIP